MRRLDCRVKQLRSSRKITQDAHASPGSFSNGGGADKVRCGKRAAPSVGRGNMGHEFIWQWLAFRERRRCADAGISARKTFQQASVNVRGRVARVSSTAR